MRWITVLCGIVLLVAFTLIAGLWIGHKGSWPMSTILEIKPYLQSFRKTGLFLREYSYFARGKDVPDQRYTVYNLDLAQPGFLFVARIELPEHVTVAELINPSGETVQQWRISYSELVDPDSGEIPTHDVILMRDGSVIANFDDAPGMVRVDACGKSVWSRNDAYFHHSLSPDDTGGIWTWESHGSSASQYQKLVRFDEDTGQTLESIDLINDVISANEGGYLSFILPEDFRFKKNSGEGPDDIFHPNDVEPLLADMAPAFPDFEAGDLLVSLRNSNMLAVIGHQDHTIKWAAYGPWWRQHDADFHADGTITVFSNYSERQRSEVLRVVPGVKNSVSVVPTDRPFYSALMGKHQITANGNLLVASPWGGRVVEFAPDGRAVREYVNILDGKYSGMVSTAQLIDPDYINAEPPFCANSSKKRN